MPQLGETVAEGTITRWYKTVGDMVSPGDVLFEIESDKTSMEVPATAGGVLSQIRVATGVTVAVGSVVAVLESVKNQTDAAQPVAPVASTPEPARSFDPLHSVRTPARNFGPGRLRNGVRVTPLARRLAAQTGVELSAFAGSGPDGRIVAKDVQPAATAGAGAPDGAMTPIHAQPAAGQIKAMFKNIPFVEVAIDGMRRAIARRLTEAKQSIPHFYLSIDIAMEQLLALRVEINAQADGAFKLSINDFLIKATAMALQRVPQANSVWAEECILRFEHSDVAAAVAVKGGLFTPVIRQAELKSVIAISKEMTALVERAHSNNLKPADYRGGSISISNLGMHSVREFTAIINPPQSAVLAVGAAERRPVEGTTGSVRFESVMTVTLSCDHRVIDGVLGAELLAAFKLLMQAPRLLLA